MPPVSTSLNRLICEAFTALREQDIPFVVMRNYEHLPHEVGNDLDLLVSQHQRDHAEQVLLAVGAALGFRLHNRAESPHVLLFLSHVATSEQIQIDFFSDCMWRGVNLIPAEAVIESRVHGQLFDTPNPVHEAAISLLMGLLYHGIVNDKYTAFIASTFATHSREALDLLGPLIGSTQARAVIAYSAAREWGRLASRAPKLRRILFARQVLKHPLITVRSIWSNELSRIAHRIKQPPGLAVAVIGPDGSGKSTLAQALRKKLGGTWRDEDIHCIHWKPSLSSSAVGVKPRSIVNPHGSPTRRRASSIIYFLYHLAGFITGAVVRIRPLLFQGKLVILDRYYYDFLVDPNRFRLNINAGLVCAAYRFIFKPDLVLCLDLPAEVTQARKEEVSHEETARQRNCYLEITKGLQNGCVIDASRTIDHVATEAMEYILFFMAARTDHRLRRERLPSHTYVRESRLDQCPTYLSSSLSKLRMTRPSE